MRRTILAGAAGFMLGLVIGAEYVIHASLARMDRTFKKINDDLGQLEQKAKADAARREALHKPVEPGPPSADRIPPPYPPLPTR